MTSNEIRKQFLEFFRGKEHTIVPSSPVVPFDDPTLMFTNAGMNQFKDVFLGTGSRPYSRAADTQKCIRAGGKHNDLDDVGQDTYHHTFFEMLGNWSFGDYFKAEAIAWAWELLTGVWGIEKDRLYATYFEGDAGDGLAADDEAARLWREKTDIDPSHVLPGGKKDNFWEMGETGPCGPCSEIHIDLTPDKSGGKLVNAGDHRVIEIWNLVFIQFNRAADGKLSPLPDKHVDTGMGFERLCAVLQGKKSNYDTDVWTPIFDAIRKRTGAPAYTGTLPSASPAPPSEPRPSGSGLTPSTSAAPATPHAAQIMVDVSYRVIADHARCLTFALTDGAIPSNEGRGYVLRRILRRAVRYGRQYLDMYEPFVCDLVEPIVHHMGEAFPELRSAHGDRNVEHVADIIRDEEESFGRTLDRGIRLFAEAAEHAATHHRGRISGEDAFKLHDTYGFPIDLTEQMAEERGLTVNIGEYERLMEEARDRARAAGAELQGFNMNIVGTLPPTDDAPKYTSWLPRAIQHAYGMDAEPATLLGYVRDGTYMDSGSVPHDDTVGLVLDRTTFYGEQGGQVGDTGVIELAEEVPTGKASATFRVRDTQRFGETVLHVGELTDGAGEMSIGRKVLLRVDARVRSSIMENHTATHMLNWALREVLGEGVQQKGSLVDAEKTRFDFSHGKPMTIEEVTRVEQLVNDQIAADLPVYTKTVAQEKARQIDTLRAVFGEKYADQARVVSVGASVEDMLADPHNPKWMKHPVEFCGGTHISHTGEAARFVLVSEEAVAKGVRRVVGITGERARHAEQTGKNLLGRIAALENEPDDHLADRLTAFQAEMNAADIPLRVRNELRERLAALQQRAKDAEKQKAAESGGAVMERMADLLANAETIAGVTVVVGEVPSAAADALRGGIDWVRNKTKSSAVLLGMAADGKVTLVAGMSKDAVTRGLKAGDLIKEIAPIVGGRGGGRPDMAQGGGTEASKLADALAAARQWLGDKLG